MSTKDKRIARMRTNPRGCSIEDVDWLLMSVSGCTWRQKGSHRIYTHPVKKPVDFPDGVNVVSARPIKPLYIERMLAYYDALNLEEEGEV